MILSIFVFLFFFGNGMANVKNKYVGCFKDPINRMLSGSMTIIDALTPEACINNCLSKRFRFAGIQNSRQCFCGNDLNMILRASEADCNMNCPGNSAFKCGGLWSLSIYYTGNDALNYKYLGCFQDSARRALNGLVIISDVQTTELCVNNCYIAGFRIAGTQNSKECYCGNSLNLNTKVNEGDCNINCAGNQLSKCGGIWKLSVYNTGIPEITDITSKYVGCFKESDNRMLKGLATINYAQTPELCFQNCYSKGFQYSGTQVSTECYCGNEINLGAKTIEDECNMICAGNQALKCGGPWRLRIYQTGKSDVLNDRYLGCFQDSVNRMLDGGITVSDVQTPQACADNCFGKGFRFAGAQNGKECFCGNNLNLNAKTNEGDCYIPCGGNPALKCGGPWRLSVYSAVQGANTSKGKYIGCFQDSANRMLDGAIIVSDVQTPELCTNNCNGRGFRFAGAQNAKECFCGSNINMNAKASEGDCYINCAGNSAVKCGGPWRLSVYSTGLE